jgi:hypothetical protein
MAFSPVGIGGFHTPDKARLPCSTYFTTMVLCVYDNILGPTILRQWVGKEDSNVQEPEFDQLLMITNYVIKDEACRDEKINGIETKFYALKKFDIISCSYIFRAPLCGGKMALFAFFVTLPYSELSEFMPRYSLCEDKIHHILKKYFVTKMEERKYEMPKRVLISDQVEDLINGLEPKLVNLCQIMVSVRHESLPSQISVSDM